MILKIGKKEYELKFGFAAINYLDSIYKANIDGMIDYGMGLNMLVLGLRNEDISVGYHFIKAGTVLEKQKPSNEEIEEYFGGLDEKGFTDFFEKAIECLKTQSLIKVKIAKIIRQQEKKAGAAGK